jgi:hypothetical protein
MSTMPRSCNNWTVSDAGVFGASSAPFLLLTELATDNSVFGCGPLRAVYCFEN